MALQGENATLEVLLADAVLDNADEDGNRYDADVPARLRRGLDSNSFNETSGSAGRGPSRCIYGLDVICIRFHSMRVQWAVVFHPEFEPEFKQLAVEVQDELLAYARLLEAFGPRLRRPHADTLDGSCHARMKELRFSAADGAWRVAFAFDPQQRAILLVAGDKAGVNERRFYRRLIAKADARYAVHLARMNERKRK